MPPSARFKQVLLLIPSCRVAHSKRGALPITVPRVRGQGKGVPSAIMTSLAKHQRTTHQCNNTGCTLGDPPWNHPNHLFHPGLNHPNRLFDPPWVYPGQQPPWLTRVVADHPGSTLVNLTTLVGPWVADFTVFCD